MKLISNMYQMLTGSELWHKYNTFGLKESIPEGGFINPKNTFGTILGGEHFLPLIGQLSITCIRENLSC
jgi:hypothetical protein